MRSWDAIPYGAYVASFHGLIRPPSADGSEEDDTFVFALDKRSDFSWDNKILDEPDRCVLASCCLQYKIISTAWAQPSRAMFDVILWKL